MSAAARARRLLPFAAFAALLCLYLSTLTAGNTYDAVIYALFVEGAVGGGALGVDFFAPQHVLHLPTATAITWGLQASGVPAGGLLVLQMLAAVGGAAAGALLMARLADEAGLPLAVATALATAVYAGNWFFATDGETNHIGIAFAIGALFPIRTLLEGEPTRRSVAGAGILLAGAAMFHLTLGTLWIALLGVTLLRFRPRLRPVVASLALASALLAVAYIPRAVMLERMVPDWKPAHLVVFYSEAPGGSYLLLHGFRPWQEWLTVVRGAAPGEGLACLLAQAGPWLWLVATAAALVALRGRGPALLGLAAAWFAGNLLLYASWGDLDFEFTCFIATPLAIAGAVGAACLLPSRRGRLVAAGLQLLIAGSMAVAAWRSTIEPQMDPADNPYRVLADEVESATKPGDVVLASEVTGNKSKVYIPYFAQRTMVVPEFYFGPSITTEESLRRLRARLLEACTEAGTLHALPQLIEPGGPPPSPWDLDATRAFLRGLQPEPALVDPATGRVVLYRLRRCPG